MSQMCTECSVYTAEACEFHAGSEFTCVNQVPSLNQVPERANAFMEQARLLHGVAVSRGREKARPIALAVDEPPHVAVPT